MEKLLEVTFGFAAPFVTRAAILLGIPDILADGPLSLQQILERLPAAKEEGQAADPEALLRILTFLVAHGVLADGGENEKLYSGTDVSNLLLKDNSFAPVVLMLCDKDFFAPFRELHRVVLEGGGDGFSKAHGMPIWEFAAKNPQGNRMFNDAMAAKTKYSVNLGIVGNYHGFGDLESIVDVAGGNGYFLSTLVAAHPRIRAINFDLPHVVNAAPEIQGVKHVPGNMFESIPSADAIFLQSVLHNWSDEKCLQILENCFAALPDHGRVLITEMNLSDDKFALVGLCFDMVMMAHCGGKERTEEGFHDLVTRAGFKRMNVVRLPFSWAVFEAFKTSSNEHE